MLLGRERRRETMFNQPQIPMQIDTSSVFTFGHTSNDRNGQNSPCLMHGVINGGARTQTPELILNHSKQLQDDLQELGIKIKHYEDNVGYLRNLKNNLDESILDMQVALSKYHGSPSSSENDDTAHVESEKDTIQHILRHEKSAAALVCRIKSNSAGLVANYSCTKDVLGVVATLGNVDDDRLSRLLSKYVGLQTMLAVVCKTFEGVKALEAYNKDGSINKGLGLHAYAASTGTSLDERFQVICLEDIRPYTGDFIEDDPQRKLSLLKPRLLNGETPAGFLGFAVNMVSIDYTNLNCGLRNGRSLRETLFYHLFSNLQVYRSRDEMMKARSFISNGAISLDGGMIRSPGILSLSHHEGDVGVKFPIGSKRLILPQSTADMENKLKETNWKLKRTLDDMRREQALLDQSRFKYELKKQELLQCLAQGSSFAAQVMGASTPR